MRALSIRQPWAWSILHAGKDVENRQWRHRPGHHGPTLLHAGKARPTRQDYDAVAALSGGVRPAESLPRGGFVGAMVLDLPHHADDCLTDGVLCSRWALPDSWHLPVVLTRPLELVPANGQLGFWTPTMTTELATAMHAAAHPEETRP